MKVKAAVAAKSHQSCPTLCYPIDDSLPGKNTGVGCHCLLHEKERREWKNWLKTQHSKNQDHGIRSHHFMPNRWGNNGNSERLFSWAPKSLQMVTAATKLKDSCSLEEKLWQTPRQHIKKQILDIWNFPGDLCLSTQGVQFLIPHQGAKIPLPK